MNSKKILITEKKDFSSKAIKLLEKRGFKVDLQDLNYNNLIKIIKKYDGMIIRLGIKIDKKMIDKGNNLKFIATPTTGLDHIDIDYALKKGIKIISLKNEKRFLNQITPTAELTFGLILTLLRKIPEANISVKKNIWDRDLFIGEDLKNKNLGIVGLGRLGLQVAKIGKAFKMNIAYYDPYVNNKKYNNKKTLKSLLEWSDIISLHVHLNNQTINLINKTNLKYMKPNSYIINTSRGEIINEKDLLYALNHKLIKGAALDVLSNELNNSKKISSKLIDYSKNNNNLIITPHIGGATKESMRMTEEFIIKKSINQYEK